MIQFKKHSFYKILVRKYRTQFFIVKLYCLFLSDQLASDPDLIDIDAATTELRNIRTHQQKVIKLATGSLNQGILTENSVQTTTALQVVRNFYYFFNKNIGHITFVNQIR